jgi:hypothetical protein
LIMWDISDLRFSFRLPATTSTTIMESPFLFNSDHKTSDKEMKRMIDQTSDKEMKRMIDQTSDKEMKRMIDAGTNATQGKSPVALECGAIPSHTIDLESAMGAKRIEKEPKGRLEDDIKSRAIGDVSHCLSSSPSACPSFIEPPLSPVRVATAMSQAPIGKVSGLWSFRHMSDGQRQYFILGERHIRHSCPSAHTSVSDLIGRLLGADLMSRSETTCSDDDGGGDTSTCSTKIEMNDAKAVAHLANYLLPMGLGADMPAETEYKENPHICVKLAQLFETFTTYLKRLGSSSDVIQAELDRRSVAATQHIHKQMRHMYGPERMILGRELPLHEPGGTYIKDMIDLMSESWSFLSSSSSSSSSNKDGSVDAEKATFGWMVASSYLARGGGSDLRTGRLELGADTLWALNIYASAFSDSDSKKKWSVNKWCEHEFVTHDDRIMLMLRAHTKNIWDIIRLKQHLTNLMDSYLLARLLRTDWPPAPNNIVILVG